MTASVVDLDQYRPPILVTNQVAQSSYVTNTTGWTATTGATLGTPTLGFARDATVLALPVSIPAGNAAGSGARYTLPALTETGYHAGRLWVYATANAVGKIIRLRLRDSTASAQATSSVTLFAGLQRYTVWFNVTDVSHTHVLDIADAIGGIGLADYYVSEAQVEVGVLAHEWVPTDGAAVTQAQQPGMIWRGEDTLAQGTYWNGEPYKNTNTAWRGTNAIGISGYREHVLELRNQSTDLDVSSAQAISSISGDGTTVTVTTTASNDFEDGDGIHVAGTVAYNGDFGPVTTTNATTFTYAGTATGAEATGTAAGLKSKVHADVTNQETPIQEGNEYWLSFALTLPSSVFNPQGGTTTFGRFCHLFQVLGVNNSGSGPMIALDFLTDPGYPVLGLIMKGGNPSTARANTTTVILGPVIYDTPIRYLLHFFATASGSVGSGPGYVELWQDGAYWPYVSATGSGRRLGPTLYTGDEGRAHMACLYHSQHNPTLATDDNKVAYNIEAWSSEYRIGFAAEGAAATLGRVHDLAAGGTLVPVTTWRTTVAASQTDAVLVPAVSGSKLRVVGLELAALGAATTATLTSKPSGAGTAISPTYNPGYCHEGDLNGLFQTATGEGLSLTTGAGGGVSARVSYLASAA